MKKKDYVTAAFIFCILFCCNVCLPAYGQSDSGIGKIKKVYIVEEGLWPPYSFEKEGTPTKGISLEIMNAIFSRLGIEIDMKLFPQKRILKYMEYGEKDIIPLASKNREREKYLDYTLPLLEEKGVIFYSTNRKDSVKWADFEDLTPYRIGTVRGYNYGAGFEDAVKKYNLTLDEVITNEQNFKKLDAGRIDILLVNQSTASEFMRTHPEYRGRFETANKPYMTYVYHTVFSKRSDARLLIPAVNEVIKQLKEEGIIDNILKKYHME
ncbi:MAG: amino acid ABC transporter substrate-binding protein [Desulfobacteraceae bacterium]|nr:amino acid ABC transporter substrate-binding protein [Desulfobacteraceae bacterium]